MFLWVSAGRRDFVPKREVLPSQAPCPRRCEDRWFGRLRLHCSVGQGIRTHSEKGSRLTLGEYMPSGNGHKLYGTKEGQFFQFEDGHSITRYRLVVE